MKDYWKVRDSLFKDGKLIPAKDRPEIKEQKEMKKRKEQVQKILKKIKELQPYCPEGKRKSSKSHIKAVVTEQKNGFMTYEYFVDYYEGKKLVEKMHFRNIPDLVRYLHGIGGEEFITRAEDFNYDNVFFCKNLKKDQNYHITKW